MSNQFPYLVEGSSHAADPGLLQQRKSASLGAVIAGRRRMQAGARRDAGALSQDLQLPDLHDYAVRVTQPGVVAGEAARIQAEFVHDAIASNPSRLQDFNLHQPQSSHASINRNAPFLVVRPGCAAEAEPVYLPPDVNTLLCVTEQCLLSRNAGSVIVAGNQPLPQWLDMDAAISHCAAGIGIWHWASNDAGTEPDVVMACCGDVPTLETLAAVEILRQLFPALKIRVVNVVDLRTLQTRDEHPCGLTDEEFDALFTRDKPIEFAFNGNPALIHQLVYRRTSQDNLQVRGYRIDATTITPFDMAVQNGVDRFHLAGEVIDRLPQLQEFAAGARRFIRERLAEHRRHIREYGEDMPQIREWTWGGGCVVTAAALHPPASPVDSLAGVTLHSTVQSPALRDNAD